MPKMIRTFAGWADLVHAPRVQHALGPVCMTCGKLVDSEELVEGYPGESGTCKVLVKHHGAEELATFDMGSTNWDAEDLASMMRRRNWFDPTRHEGMGLGREIANPGDCDDIEAAKPFVGPLIGGGD